MPNNMIEFYINNSDIQVFTAFLKRRLYQSEMAQVQTILDKHDFTQQWVQHENIWECLQEVEEYIDSLDIKLKCTGLQGFD